MVEDASLDSLRARVERGALDGYFVLPVGLIGGEEEAAFYSEGIGGFSSQIRLEQAVEDVVRRARLRATGASEDVLRAAEADVPMRIVALTDEGEAEDTSWIYTGLGYAMGLIIYIAMFVYGAMVMRGVIEEKTNRIVEVVASSAKPFQLMMGKSPRDRGRRVDAVRAVGRARTRRTVRCRGGARQHGRSGHTRRGRGGRTAGAPVRPVELQCRRHPVRPDRLFPPLLPRRLPALRQPLRGGRFRP